MCTADDRGKVAGKLTTFTNYDPTRKRDDVSCRQSPLQACSDDHSNTRAVFPSRSAQNRRPVDDSRDSCCSHCREHNSFTSARSTPGYGHSYQVALTPIPPTPSLVPDCRTPSPAYSLSVALQYSKHSGMGGLNVAQIVKGHSSPRSFTGRERGCSSLVQYSDSTLKRGWRFLSPFRTRKSSSQRGAGASTPARSTHVSPVCTGQLGTARQCQLLDLS